MHKERPRRILQISNSGGLYKARWAGSADSTFGATPEEATKNLKDFYRTYKVYPYNTKGR